MGTDVEAFARIVLHIYVYLLTAKSSRLGQSACVDCVLHVC